MVRTYGDQRMGILKPLPTPKPLVPRGTRDPKAPRGTPAAAKCDTRMGILKPLPTREHIGPSEEGATVDPYQPARQAATAAARDPDLVGGPLRDPDLVGGPQVRQPSTGGSGL